MLSHLARMARLGRWLGPWTDPTAAPSAVLRRAIHLPASADSREMEAWIYRPERPPEGSLLLLPGLHYLGPADPRLDRFCRVLADAGALVLCPFLPDFRQQLVGPGLGSDASRALTALLELPDHPVSIAPGVFSISFGSLPALEVAATRPEVGRLMLFGGYADWNETVRFCLTGRYGDDGRDRHHDPLNRPVVFRSLTPFFEGVDTDARNQVSEAWFEQVRRTWGRPELKEPGALDPIALEIGQHLHGAARTLYLQGVGLAPGGDERVGLALDRAGDHFDYLDPAPWGANVRIPTVIAHGRDDDVIPFEHAERLRRIVPGARLFVTGAYAHTGQAPMRDLVPNAAAELRAMGGLIAGMARTACVTVTSRSD